MAAKGTLLPSELRLPLAGINSDVKASAIYPHFRTCHQRPQVEIHPGCGKPSQSAHPRRGDGGSSIILGYPPPLAEHAGFLNCNSKPARSNNLH